jgi:hypothetical protein
MPEKWRHQPGCNNVLPQQLSIVLVSREKSLRNFIENLKMSEKKKDRKKNSRNGNLEKKLEMNFTKKNL